MFADDSMMIHNCKTAEEPSKGEQSQSILNANKTKVMHIELGLTMDIILDNTMLETVTNFKYLGFLIEKKRIIK